MSNAGTLVLETGRIFGGDVQFYYLGSYELSGDTVNARVSVRHFNGPGDTAFGTITTGSFEVELEGSRDASGTVIRGFIWMNGQRHPRLPFHMKRLAALP